MKLEEYQKLVHRTAGNMTNDDDKQIMNWELGIAGEAGDVAGCIKPLVIRTIRLQTQGKI